MGISLLSKWLFMKEAVKACLLIYYTDGSASSVIGAFIEEDFSRYMAAGASSCVLRSPNNMVEMIASFREWCGIVRMIGGLQ